MTMTIEEVLREMRTSEMRESRRIEVWVLEQWADAIEAAMREPMAYYWMGKWHRYEVHMADDLPCNAPHDKQALYAFPPDAQAEIERLQDSHLHNENLMLIRERTRLLSEIELLQETLHRISLASQNSMSSKEECGRIARTALAKKVKHD